MYNYLLLYDSLKRIRCLSLFWSLYTIIIICQLQTAIDILILLLLLLSYIGVVEPLLWQWKSHIITNDVGIYWLNDSRTFDCLLFPRASMNWIFCQLKTSKIRHCVRWSIFITFLEHWGLHHIQNNICVMCLHGYYIKNDIFLLLFL